MATLAESFANSVEGRITARLEEIGKQIDLYLECSQQGANQLQSLLNADLRLRYLYQGSWGVFEGEEDLQDRVEYFLEGESDREWCVMNTFIEELEGWRNDLYASSLNLQRLVGSIPLDEICDFSLPLTSYCQYVREIVGMVDRDLNLKRTILEEIREPSLRSDTALLYVSAWEMSPSIDMDRVDEFLDVMETDLSMAWKGNSG